MRTLCSRTHVRFLSGRQYALTVCEAWFPVGQLKPRELWHGGGIDPWGYGPPCELCEAATLILYPLGTPEAWRSTIPARELNAQRSVPLTEQQAQQFAAAHKARTR